MKKKIKELKLKIFNKKELEIKYNEDRKKFIANYEELESGFWGVKYKRRPDVGEAEWNRKYPTFSGWCATNAQRLTGFGQQDLANKIDEIIRHLNNL